MASSETLRVGYQSLCEVQLLHRYFLNVGLTAFEDDPTDASVLAARRDYDLRQFWRLEPSPATAALLRRHQLLLRPTAEGLRVAGPLAAAPPAAPLELTFWAYPTDANWLLYTQLPPEPATATRPETDKLTLLRPDAEAPAGRVLAFTAPAAPPSSLPASGLEPLALALEPWPGTEAGPRPVAVLRLPLAEGGPPRHFAYVLDNRYTYWQYKNQTTSKLLPLVRHGRLDAGFGPTVPNPTPATTQAQGAAYYSRSY